MPQVLRSLLQSRPPLVYLSGAPGSADAAGPQVPIPAQTVVGLVPGVPGSADAAGSHQVPIADRPLRVLCQASQVQQMPQVLRSSLQHEPPWVYCQVSQVQLSAARALGVLVPGVPGSVDVTGPQVPIVAQTTGYLRQAAQAPGVHCGGWDSHLKFPSWLCPQQPKKCCERLEGIAWCERRYRNVLGQGRK